MENFFDKRALLGPRLIAQIVTATGVAGLLLGLIGLYGVVAYSVSRRTREIGIRMAIGARPGDVLRMVLRQGTMFTVIGVAIGLAIAIPVLHGDFFKFFATGINPFDPLILFGLPAMLAAVMIVACAIPSRRASRIDPVRTLQVE